MRTRVNIRNDQDQVRVNVRRVKGLVTRVLKKERAQKRELTIWITDDARIRKAHDRYMGMPTATDVLAFGFLGPTHVSGEGQYLGDVLVSAQTAKRRCREFRCTPHEELERYVVHGVLHLLGYRDKRKTDAQKMHNRQEAYLKGRLSPSAKKRS